MKAHITAPIVRTSGGAESDKSDKNWENGRLNNKLFQEEKKMRDKLREEERSTLNHYTDWDMSRKNILRWARQGVERYNQVSFDKVTERLINRGYLDFRLNAPVGDKLSDLRNEDSVLTNRGVEYMDRLNVQNAAEASGEVKFYAIVAAIAAVVAALVAILNR